MRTYYIEEKQMEMTYLNLRLLLFVDCDLKYKKITELLNYLNNKGFLVNLTAFYCENVTSESYLEGQDIMSLSIDMVNDKMRFKFWNGASTFWLYHLSDVYDALDTGRNEFSQLYDKYEPVTEVLFDFKRRWRTSIHHISYQYYPYDDDVELVYRIIFTQEVKDTQYTNKLINKMNNEITMLGTDVTKDLNFRIEHSFKTSGCTPCQEARKEHEEKNKKNNE